MNDISIAWQGELEFLGATEDDRTGRTVQFRLIRKLDEMGMAHPFGAFTRRRRGHAGTRFKAVFQPIDMGRGVDGEIMLLNWADGPKGATVKFLLHCSDPDHPFLYCDRRTPDAGGTSFMAVLLELDDDDVVVNQAKRERYEKSQQKLSNVAAMMVKYPRFHEWLREIAGPAPSAEDGEYSVGQWGRLEADAWIKDELDISSKGELDRDTKAARRFLTLRSRYTDWLDANKFDRE